jgi:DNA polymerase I
LSIQYDTSAPTLAITLGQPLYIAGMLLDRHRRLYRQYWHWSDNMVDHARLNHFTESRLGWRLQVNMGAKTRTLRNFPIQSAGAEMLRLAVCDCTEAGLLVCAPIHDAILLLTPTDRMETNIRLARYFMERASCWVLKDVLKIRVDHHDFVHPDRFVDNRGVQLWNFVNGFLRSKGFGARQDTNQRVIAV